MGTILGKVNGIHQLKNFFSTSSIIKFQTHVLILQMLELQCQQRIAPSHSNKSAAGLSLLFFFI
jgi:hypothetical protein